MDTLGAVMGALVAWWLLGRLGGDYRAVFLWAGIPGVLAVSSIIFLVRESGRPEDRSVDDGTGLDQRLPRSFRMFLLAHGLFFLGNVSYAFFMLRAGDGGTPEVALNLLYFVWNLAYSLGAFPAGHVVDAAGARPVLVLTGVGAQTREQLERQGRTIETHADLARFADSLITKMKSA